MHTELRANDVPAVMPIVIDGIDQLRTLLTDPLFRSKRPILLHLDGLPPDQVRSITEAINRDRTSCACGLAAAALFTGLVTSGAAVAATFGPLTWAALKSIPIVIATGVASAGAGKAIGIARSQRRAKRTMLRLLELATAEAGAGLANNQ